MAAGCLPQGGGGGALCVYGQSRHPPKQHTGAKMVGRWVKIRMEDKNLSEQPTGAWRTPSQVMAIPPAWTLTDGAALL